jgi:dihydroxy-acid dehydratase
MMRVSNASVSRTATGTVVLHVYPEAAVEGALGCVRNGDMIELIVDASQLDLLVDPEELRARPSSAPFREPPTRGYETLHRTHVLWAGQGHDFDFLLAGPILAWLGCAHRPRDRPG